MLNAMSLNTSMQRLCSVQFLLNKQDRAESFAFQKSIPSRSLARRKKSMPQDLLFLSSKHMMKSMTRDLHQISRVNVRANLHDESEF